MQQRIRPSSDLLISEKKGSYTAGSLILSLLNLYFSFRFILVFVNYSQHLDIYSTVILVFFLVLTTAIAVLSIFSSLICYITNYFRNQRVIFELFIWFLVGNQILEWLLKHLKAPAILEIRSWFFTITLWITFSLIVQKINQFLPELFPGRNRNSSIVLSLRDRSIFRAGLLVVIGCIAGFWFYTQLINPLPHYYHYDPEYAYLLSAITPFQDGLLYKRMDHPGTLMQILGSSFHIILNSTKIASAGIDANLFITHPEYYLVFARLFILAITLFAVIKLATIAIPIRDLADIFAALSVPLVYFTHHNLSLDFTAIWSPNSFNFALGTLLLAVLLVRLSTKEQITPPGIISISLAAGLIGTFQIYMLVWIVGISASFFLDDLFRHGRILPAIRTLGLSVTYSLIGYVVGTLVIINQYKSLLDWIWSIIYHQGQYGAGPEGILTGQLLITNFRDLASSMPKLFLVTLALVASVAFLFIYFRKSFREQSGTWAVAFGLIIQIIVLLLMVFKHPRDRYLLSLAAILPILFAAVAILIAKLPRVKSYLYPAVFCLLVLAMIFSIEDAINRHQENVTNQQAYETELSKFLESTAEANDIDKGQLDLYWTYGSYSPCFSLWFGNEYAKNLFSNQIEKYCNPQNSYAINIWNKKIFPADREPGNINLSRKSIIIGEPLLLKNKGYEVYGNILYSDIENLGFILID